MVITMNDCRLHFRGFVFTVLLVIASVHISNAQITWKENTVATGTNAAVTGVVDGANHTLFAVTAGAGLYQSTDGGTTWGAVNTGLPREYFYCIAKNPLTGYIYVGTYDGYAYRTTNNGTTWSAILIDNSRLNNPSVDTSKSSITCFLFNSDSTMFVGTAGSGIVHSTRGDNSWVKMNNGLSSQSLFILALARDSRGHILAGTYGVGIMESVDKGLTWQSDNNVPGGNITIRMDVRRVNAFATDYAGRTYAATDNGIYRDTLNYDTLGIDTIGHSPLVLDTLIDTVHVWWEYDSGIPRDVSGGSGPNDIDGLSLLATPDSSSIYVGTVAGGVYYSSVDSSDSSGGAFSAANTGVNGMNIVCLYLSDSGYVFAGTDGGDLYKSSQRFNYVLTQVAPPPRLPATAELEQNFPNPFNPTTTIPFKLTQGGFVSLIVYNSLGEEVTRLVNGNLSAGEYGIKWDASSLASGAYFYHLQTANFSKTGKLMLIK